MGESVCVRMCVCGRGEGGGGGGGGKTIIKGKNHFQGDKTNFIWAKMLLLQGGKYYTHVQILHNDHLQQN